MRHLPSAFALSLLLAVSCKEDNNNQPTIPAPAVCGDGEVGRGESCDDANLVDTDECHNDCSLPFCGDGVLDAGEACDDGDFDNTNACTNACLDNTCGNNVADTGELCFTLQPSAPAAQSPFAITTADMNGDQLDDLILSELAQGVAVFLGDGAGGFAAPLRAASAETPFGVVAADLDNDGDIDAATSNNIFDAAGNIASCSVTIFLNDGTGQLTAQGAPLPIAANTSLNITAGDLDSDGSQDLVVAGLASSNLSLLFNNGSAVFTETEVVLEPQFFFGASPFAALAADFDNDDDDDLLVADSASPTMLLLRNDEGALALETSVALGFGQGQLAAGDLDGDQLLDFVSTTFGGAGVSAAFNGGGGIFGNVSPGIVDGPSGAVIADLNNDGRADVITSNGGDLFGDNPGNSVTIFLQDEQGAINPISRITVDSGPSAIIAADFNQDGTPDIAVSNLVSSSISILLSGI
jgi:cysteine-rich repeat protein